MGADVWWERFRLQEGATYRPEDLQGRHDYATDRFNLLPRNKLLADLVSGIGA